MAGFTTRRLVLVLATHSRDGSDAFDVGTGYFLTSDLVLTASHVVPEQGVTRLDVRTENDGEWRKANPTPVWRDAVRDAVLLRVVTPLPDVGDPDWLEGDLQDDAVWHSSGYPDAGKILRDGRPAW